MKKLLTAVLIIFSVNAYGQTRISLDTNLRDFTTRIPFPYEEESIISSPMPEHEISLGIYHNKYPDFNYHAWGFTIDSLLNCASFYVIDEYNEMTAIIVFENSVSFYYNGNILILNNKGGMLWNGIMIDRNTRQDLDELKHFWSKFNRKK